MNKYLVKIARKTEEQTRPHVDQAHKKLDSNKGLILHWGTGAGKSKFFLEATKKALEENKTDDALIVAPASLTTNIDKELAKHKIKLDRKRLHVLSYEAANNKANELVKRKYSIAVADEAQKLRNPNTQRSKSLTEVFSKADKRLLATATANYNSVSDIAPLANIAAGYEVLPTDRKKFENKFIKWVDKPRTLMDRILGNKPEKKTVLNNHHELARVFKDHVHYYDPKDDPAAKNKFPELNQKIIKVDMDSEQQKYYDFANNKLPFLLRYKIKYNLPLDKQEKSNLNSFSAGIRQISNSYRGFRSDPHNADYTPKIKKAVASLEEGLKNDKNFRGLVYSNYLDAGVHEYSRLLNEKGISHGIFTGSLTKEEKDKLQEDFNSGKIKALLISSSGAEGLNLRGTKKVQILESYFNPSRIKQVIGRSSRYESHEHLPKEERKVEVEHYHSVYPKSIFGNKGLTIDEYLHLNSDEKQELFDQIKEIMKATT